MKKLALFAVLLAGTALAANYIFFAETQIGNGTNGMSRAAPTLATEGVSVVKSSYFSPEFARAAKVSIRASGSNILQNATDLAWLRCYHWSPGSRDSTGATYEWKRCSSMDIEVDGGQSGLTFANSMEFPEVPLPKTLTTTDRLLWACSNCQQSGTLDAGVTVSIEMVTGPIVSPNY